MKPDQVKDIEKIIGQIECPKDFKCFQVGFEKLCKANDIGLETHLICEEAKPQECVFSISYGDSYYCNCPLRLYIAQNFE